MSTLREIYPYNVANFFPLPNLGENRPICRTVTDAVYVLDAIVGFDKYDALATGKASKYIPQDGYLKHLKSGGLKGKRLGIMRAYSYFGFANDTQTLNKFEKDFDILR